MKSTISRFEENFEPNINMKFSPHTMRIIMGYRPMLPWWPHTELETGDIGIDVRNNSTPSNEYLVGQYYELASGRRKICLSILNGV